jgi:hypothetical protein
MQSSKLSNMPANCSASKLKHVTRGTVFFTRSSSYENSVEHISFSIFIPCFSVTDLNQTISRSTTPKPEPGYTQPTKQSTRRLSMISNSGSVTSEVPNMNGHARTSSIGQGSMPNRPPSSQSVRPDSVMSSRGHSIPPVAVKKTRTVSFPSATFLRFTQYCTFRQPITRTKDL